jgi:serine/threonine-protein kinase HipA
MDNNALSYELAKSVGIYFRLNEKQMNTILDEVFTAVASWKEIAIKIGISNKEIQLMQKAFNV